MMAETEERRAEFGSLDKNILFEILRRVDAVTLAKAACVNSEFRLVSEDEYVWENLCNELWPSTKRSAVMSLVSSTGGYRKLYRSCYPCIVMEDDLEQPPDSEAHENREMRCQSALSSSDFVSIVDVVYGDQSVLSKIVEGIPGDDYLHGWLSNCGFRLDVLRSELESTSRTPEAKCEHGNVIVIQSETLSAAALKSQAQKAGGRSGSAVWNILKEKMRVSWIVINKRTKLMTNLSSLMPVGGRCHWASDDDYSLRFSSVLPGPGDGESANAVVQCNITMVCRLNLKDIRVGDSVKTVLVMSLSELSLQLENLVGELAIGKHIVDILESAVFCPKSRHCENVLESNGRYEEAKNGWKARQIKADSVLNATAAITSGICSAFFILWYLLY